MHHRADEREERAALEQLMAAERNAIKVHCYRMLGSLADAEDATQETFTRAWGARKKLRSPSATRSWLYRIATNAALDALRRRKRERRFWGNAQPSTTTDIGVPDVSVDWLEPMPDALLSGVELEPQAAYEQGESVRLAFLACVQLLPPRQRAAFLLHEVLGWSAAEVAQAFESSTQAANSLLQRARRTFEEVYRREPQWAGASEEDRLLAERFAATFEARDVDGFVALLRSDASLRMPPWRAWFRGREAIAQFVAQAWSGSREFRGSVFRANGRWAVAVQVSSDNLTWRPHSVQVLDVVDGEIASVVAFVELGHTE